MTTGSRLRVGINGFGRIGRAITRINLQSQTFDLVAVNDINPDIANLAYLLKYDSTYGPLNFPVAVDNRDLVFDGAGRASVYCEEDVSNVPWEDRGVDIVIDSSGVEHNVAALPKLSGQDVRHCIVTNAPDASYVDKSIIIGVNEETLGTADFVVSSSICDAAAFVSVMHPLEREFGIEYGSLTTLHPWLSYQSLVDGPAFPYANVNAGYTLGRASTMSLIPKTSSCIQASSRIMPGIGEKFISLSYRVPTMIVSVADIVVKLSRPVTREGIVDFYSEAEATQRYPIIHNNQEPLVSIDFTGSEYSAIVDHRWTAVQPAGQVKLVVWYDNEWGYSSRVIDLVRHLGSLYG